jgi:hypothetical protein
MKTAERWPRQAYWNARAERAIAASLVLTNAVLKTELETLRIVQRSIQLVAARVHPQDADGWRRLGMRVADYHRADERVEQLGRRLGRRLDGLVIKRQGWSRCDRTTTISSVSPIHLI